MGSADKGLASKPAPNEGSHGDEPYSYYILQVTDLHFFCKAATEVSF